MEVHTLLLTHSYILQELSHIISMFLLLLILSKITNNNVLQTVKTLTHI